VQQCKFADACVLLVGGGVLVWAGLLLLSCLQVWSRILPCRRASHAGHPNYPGSTIPPWAAMKALPKQPTQALPTC